MCLSHLALGSLLLFGFFAIARRRRWRRWHRHAHGYGHGHGHHHDHGCDPYGPHTACHHGHGRGPFDDDDAPGPGAWGGGGFGRGFGGRMGGLSPDERRAVSDAFDDVRPSMRRARRDVADALKDVVRSFENEAFDVDVAGETLAKNRDALDRLTKDVLGALAKLHDALPPERRKTLAQTLARLLDRVA